MSRVVQPSFPPPACCPKCKEGDIEKLGGVHLPMVIYRCLQCFHVFRHDRLVHSADACSVEA